jgi:hypothetical protein
MIETPNEDCSPHDIMAGASLTGSVNLLFGAKQTFIGLMRQSSFQQALPEKYGLSVQDEFPSEKSETALEIERNNLCQPKS